MPQRLSIRRITGTITALILIVSAVYWTFAYVRMDRAYNEWIDARPTTITVNLSKPGKYTAPFKQTCRTAHSEAFYLSLESFGDRNISRITQKLRGTITINDNDGNEIQSLKMTPTIDSELGSSASILLADFRPFAKGDYTVTIDVRVGIAEIEGKEQTIYAKYLLCGLEQFPAKIAGLFALLLGIPGLIMGAFVTKGFLKHRLTQSPAKSDDSAQSPDTGA